MLANAIPAALLDYLLESDRAEHRPPTETLTEFLARTPAPPEHAPARCLNHGELPLVVTIGGVTKVHSSTVDGLCGLCSPKLGERRHFERNY